MTTKKQDPHFQALQIALMPIIEEHGYNAELFGTNPKIHRGANNGNNQIRWKIEFTTFLGDVKTLFYITSMEGGKIVAKKISGQID